MEGAGWDKQARAGVDCLNAEWLDDEQLSIKSAVKGGVIETD